MWLVPVVLPDTTQAGQLEALGSVGNADALVEIRSQYLSAPLTAVQVAAVGLVMTVLAGKGGYR